ncbi:MAG: twin-arginine translocation signal domain-containing protein [Candidatus Eisenbacteria bacterium]|nr:twin-arginine translocation signal domain-containing protein [Candidatus Eisenbacteria bacterium]
MNEADPRAVSSRRDFLRLAAAGIASALPAAALAQVPAPAPAVPPPPAGAPEPPSEAAKALASILQQRLGRDRLTAEQWESVTRDLGGDLAIGRRLAATKLANGDEPDFTFRALPEPSSHVAPPGARKG